MDSATEFLFGLSTESLIKQDSEGFAGSFTSGQEYIVHRFRWGKFTDLFPGHKQWLQDQNFVHDFVDFHVDKSLAKRHELLADVDKPDRRYVFLEELVVKQQIAEVATRKGQQPRFEQLKEMKYVRAILNESLRLYPVLPINSREAMEDTTLPLGGSADECLPIFIKKGELVTWFPYLMHRRKDF
ncbi:Hypothetical protein R9X50_00288400 [Acrodontium crateriforme]|uniref:Cytochrome P450 n=1 Tax=Acrodontium crateriforme TaxID=150365 RepID=A0AAQ3R8Z1_9PEZI|nr:Hypothetical protein R9X50_00288400 [Acrodontium crateriforme]